MRRFSAFTFSAAIVALACLVFSLLQPHSVRQGYVLGYSAVRLGMAVLLALPMVFLAVLTAGSLAQHSRVQQLVRRLELWNQPDRILTLREIALIMAVLGGYLLWKWGQLPDEKGVVLRLMPLLVFWTLFWLLGWIYAQFGLKHARITWREKLNLYAKHSGKVLAGLLLIVLAAVIVSMAGQLVRFYARKVFELVEFLVYEFDLGSERNLPTYFNVFLLAAGGMLSMIVGFGKHSKHQKFAANWMLVGCCFLLLAYDDLEQVHESFTGPLQEFFHAGGLFTFAWVIPAIVLVALFAVGNLRFFFSLPKRQQLFLLAAALVYVGGALGVEMIGGAYVEQHGFWDIKTVLLANLEETMEMSGAALFIYFLLEHLKLETA